MSPPATSSALPARVRADPLLGPEPLGAMPLPDGSTRFRAFTTTTRRCQVRLYAEDGTVLRTEDLAALDGGIHEGRLQGVGPGSLYKLVLDDRELPDPYARFLPAGVHGPAMVMASGHRFQHPGIFRPLGEQIIYEIHVGTFSPEGTYAGVAARLPALRDLGITAIELMPLAAFAGSRGWGYDGVALYAPFAGYGTPDQLRALVDEAHGLGLAVLLDVVYNHFGPAGNYLAAYSPEYFTGAIQNAWGDCPNFQHPVMRQKILENARYWLTEFRFDGLRLDAAHAIIDPSPRHILAELSDLARSLSPRRLLIAEDDRNQPALVNELHLDGIWADDFHHQVRVTLTGEQDGYYAGYHAGDLAGPAAIAETIRDGWWYQGQVYPPSGAPRGHPAPTLPAEAFVYCIQNHDQVGNRALGERLNQQVPPPAYQAVSTLLLYLPMTPLLFMGQEWAAGSPFQFFTDHEPELGQLIAQGRRSEFKAFAAFADPHRRAAIPDPQDPRTFARSKLDWSEREREPHAQTLALYRQLIQLRKTDPVLSRPGRQGLSASAEGPLLIVDRASAEGRRALVVNFGAAPVALPGALAGPAARSRILLSTYPNHDLSAPIPGFGAIILALD
jgi:maltooligosyltrehalose trehalohydrolase